MKKNLLSTLFHKILEKKILVVCALILFFIPFRWFPRGEVDYGGDSTRLYFYDPISWLKNVSLYSNNPQSTLGKENPSFFIIPFLLFLSFFKFILFNSSYLLNIFFDGLLLSGSFFVVYLFIKELLKEFNDPLSEVFSIFGGLFFCLSPTLIYEWERSLYSFNQLFVYPLTAYLLLKMVNTQKWRYLIGVLFISLIFSVNFSFNTAPWSLAFFSGFSLFLVFYAVFQKKTVFLIKRGFFLFFLFLCLHFFHLLPQLGNLLNPAAPNFKAIFNRELVLTHGLGYFSSIRPLVRLIYNLANQPQYYISLLFSHPQERMIYDYGVKFLFLYFLFPLVVALAWWRRRENKSLLSKPARQTHLLISGLFLFFTFLMTANITRIGVKIYTWLFYLPGFSMFRSYYTKFSLVFTFFYSSVLAYSLMILSSDGKLPLKKRYLRIFTYLLIILVVTSGWPLLSGKITHGSLWKSNNIRFSMKMDPLYEEAIDEIRHIRLDTRILFFPLTNEQYQLLGGEKGGVYFGPSSIPILTGIRTITGEGSFDEFWPVIKKLFEKKDYQGVSKILNILNVGYVFHDKNTYIYDNFPEYPYSYWFKSLLPNQEKIGEYLKNLDYDKVYSLGNLYLYKKLTNNLPHIYASNKQFSAVGDIGVLPELMSLTDDEDPRVQFYFNNSINRLISRERSWKELFNSIYVVAKSNQELGLSTFESVYTYQPEKSEWKEHLIDLVKEWYDEYKESDNPEKVIQQKLLNANKRINETISFLHTEKEQLSQIENYQSKIEDCLNLILKFTESKKRIETASKIKSNLESNWFMIKLTDLADRGRWGRVISELLIKTDLMIPDYRPEEKTYELEIPEPGDYEVYVGKRNIAKEMTEWKYYLADKEIPLNDSSNNDWLTSEKVTLSSGKKDLKIKLDESRDLISSDGWSLTESPIWGKISFQKEILRLEPGVWYQVSGLNLNPKNPVRLEIREKLGNGIVKQSKIVDLEILPEKFRFFFFSDPSPSKGTIFLSFEKEISPEQISGNLKELRVTPLAINPMAIFRLNNHQPVNHEVPKITFKKINPTRYLVKVEQAQLPYYLVFLDSFSPGWKVFEDDSSFNSAQTVAEYFRGEVEEIKSESSFFKADFLKSFSKKPIAEGGHFIVNGYANSWYIQPKDVSGKTEYTLLLEYQPQRNFYYGIAVSLTGLLIVLSVIFLKYFLKKRKIAK